MFRILAIIWILSQYEWQHDLLHRAQFELVMNFHDFDCTTCILVECTMYQHCQLIQNFHHRKHFHAIELHKVRVGCCIYTNCIWLMVFDRYLNHGINLRCLTCRLLLNKIPSNRGREPFDRGNENALESSFVLGLESRNANLYDRDEGQILNSTNFA